MALAGCAGLRNTPLQEYVYDRARPCESYGATVQRVAPDGAFEVLWAGGAATWPEFLACYRARERALPFADWQRQRGLTAPAR